MESIISKISRKDLYKKIYVPCEITKSEKVSEESNIKFYDEAAKFLALIYLTQKGGGCSAKE